MAFLYLSLSWDNPQIDMQWHFRDQYGPFYVVVVPYETGGPTGSEPGFHNARFKKSVFGRKLDFILNFYNKKRNLSKNSLQFLSTCVANDA